MMEENSQLPPVSRPIAVRWEASQTPQSPCELLAKLRLELEIERKKSLQLLQSLAQEKKRVFDLETMLIQANLEGEGAAKVRGVGSISSFASTEDGIGLPPLPRTSWAPRTFSAESLDSDFFDRQEKEEGDLPRPRLNRSRSPNRADKD